MAEHLWQGGEKASLTVTVWFRLMVCAAFVGLACAVGALHAEPALGYAHINSFSITPSTTQAGGHPDVDVSQTFDNRNINEEGAPSSANNPCECQDAFEVKDLFPTGFIGNPSAVPRCSLLAFSSHDCPVDSQVGVSALGFGEAGSVSVQNPIYNMEPHPGEPGLQAFYAPGAEYPVFVELSARTDSDYGLNGRSTGIYHPIPLSTVNLYLWGVPGAPAHDLNRFPAPQPGGVCTTEYPEPCPGAVPIPFQGPIAPFLENPTSCGTPLTTGLDLLYYDFTELHAESAWPATTGCDLLSFNPSLTAKPTTTQADTPSGLDLDLSVPQTQSGGTPSPSEIKAAKIILPAGFAINPNAADGKTSCSNEEAALGTLNEAKCPEHAKVGTLTLDSSALPAPIDGAVYLGTPQGGDRYRLILAANGFSTHVKLAGSVRADPETGQLTVSFQNLPQSPFQDFSVHFFGSERGLLVTPAKCGKYQVDSEFVPWDSALPNQTSTAYFAIDSGPDGEQCPGTTRPFDPQVGAGSPDSTAGAHSPFALRVLRADGEQNLVGLSVTTPPGFAASLRGVSYCPESAIAQLNSSSYSGLAERASSACPAGSLVGSATASAGAGTHPLYVPGKVYLAGPYKGAPVSLEVVIPAVSGPYDLGVVAVRAAIHVDPTTAQVTATSDPLPRILEGVPLRTRSILINLDRPEFTVNPTNCDPFSVSSTILGDEAAVSTQASHFQVANCALLHYGPELSLRLTGGLNRLGHPAIHSTFTAAPGEANTHFLSVALPRGELLDNAHIGNVCTKVLFAANSCPADSVLGSAEASSPLLDSALKGNVYLRSSSEGLPNLVADLHGQFDIELVGRIDTINGGALRTSFENVPDVPVSTFTIDLAGGSKGLLQNEKSLCGKAKRATVKMVGQNAVAISAKTKLQLACSGSKSRHKRHHPTGQATASR